MARLVLDVAVNSTYAKKHRFAYALFYHFALRADRDFFLAAFLADFRLADFLPTERLVDLRAPRADFAAGRFDPRFLAVVLRPAFERPDFLADLLFLAVALVFALALAFVDFALELDLALDLRLGADFFFGAGFLGADSVVCGSIGVLTSSTSVAATD